MRPQPSAGTPLSRACDLFAGFVVRISMEMFDSDFFAPFRLLTRL
jgi:hypothetical protein